MYAAVLCVVLLWPARRWEAVVRHGLWSRFVEYFNVEVRPWVVSGSVVTRTSQLANYLGGLSQTALDCIALASSNLPLWSHKPPRQ
jgi:hypothetical protein